ncbi:RNA-binding S4 domain-containing protein [Vibrio caribbeanicus]|uniref:RNA-binding S4 domain-containing protein n=1 Tax=Vibrio caribbeanicus TaxID=701175 RepID=UPI00228372CD|nr:RNA-binding S4 domain-containing protein [Vibrio caribbeanicus]MCY9843638.1 RNA-binding S4 domain-containing protein [Vibrio caribbeanicus]
MRDETQTSEPIEIEAFGIEVSTQPIELYKVLKIAELVSGGGEAKHFISNGYVAVNGEVEYRKRKKLYDGDYFEFNQDFYVIVYTEDKTETSNLESNASFENNSFSDNQGADDIEDRKRSEKPRQGRASIDFF